MSQISLQNLKKSFGKTQVIHDLSIDVKDGELIVIVGPSGCGKSTLLRMVAGLEDANEGNILICLLYTSPSPRDSRVSRMPSSA